MTWCWFARVEEPAGGATAVARAVRPDGTDAGWLAAWPAGRKPVAQAVRMDARLIDPAGQPAVVSLLLLPRDRSPIFDDPTVSGALRSVLEGPPPDGVSTFVRDSSHFAGSVTVRRRDPGRLRDDPFFTLGRCETLHVAGGLFGAPGPPPGPVTQRYSGQPWPAAGF